MQGFSSPFPQRQATNQVASQGRFGDSMVAHLSPAAAGSLKQRGGSGSKNPVTGLTEFFNFSTIDQSGTDDEYINRLYDEGFQRDGDAEGIAWHTDFLANGGSRADLAGNFQTASEDVGSLEAAYDMGAWQDGRTLDDDMQATFDAGGGVTTSDFVDGLYGGLNRDGDTEGIAHHKDFLAGGGTRDQLQGNFDYAETDLASIEAAKNMGAWTDGRSMTDPAQAVWDAAHPAETVPYIAPATTYESPSYETLPDYVTQPSTDSTGTAEELLAELQRQTGDLADQERWGQANANSSGRTRSVLSVDTNSGRTSYGSGRNRSSYGNHIRDDRRQGFGNLIRVGE